jgi:hypothetical protein
MTELLPAADNFWVLLDAVCDGDLDDLQIDELTTILGSDAASLTLFADHVQLRTDIGLLCRAERSSEGGLARVRANLPQESPPFAVLGGSTSRGTVGYSLQTWSLAYLVAAAVFGIGLWIGSYVQLSRPEQHVADNARPSTPPVERAVVKTVGQITGAVDCVFADPQTEPVIYYPVTVGRRYALSSGLLEITYDTGAKVLLQGPATYEIESARGGFLEIGKLTARVEKKAEGGGRRAVKSEIRNPKSEDTHPSSLIPPPSALFSVHTPTAVVTDLGTEFGVAVTAEGRTDAQVFEGVVQVTTSGKGAGARRERICRQGEAVRVDAGDSLIRTVPPAEARAAGHFRVMPVHAAGRAAQGYAQFVLSLNPVVYYRMERPNGERTRDVVFDSGLGGHHGELHLPSSPGRSPYRPGRFGDSLDFHACGGVEVPDYPITTNDQLSVSVWVMATGWRHKCVIASNWGARVGGQFHLGLLYGDGNLGARVKMSSGRTMEVQEDALLPMCVWQHVALVTDGTALRLYRNGQEVASCSERGVRLPPAINSVGARKTDDTGKRVPNNISNDNDWGLRVDELAVFDRAISAETIQQLIQGDPRHPETPKAERR